MKKRAVLIFVAIFGATGIWCAPQSESGFESTNKLIPEYSSSACKSDILAQHIELEKLKLQRDALALEREKIALERARLHAQRREEKARHCVEKLQALRTFFGALTTESVSKANSLMVGGLWQNSNSIHQTRDMLFSPSEEHNSFDVLMQEIDALSAVVVVLAQKSLSNNSESRET